MRKYRSNQTSFFNVDMILGAIFDSFKKLNPSYQIKNPVMFIVFIGSIFTTCLFFYSIAGNDAGGTPSFIASITFWLWFTVLFANFAESIAESKAKAQSSSLKSIKQDTNVKKLSNQSFDPNASNIDKKYELTPSNAIAKDDIILIESGDVIPYDGVVLYGCCSVDESAITGESAPVIRESGGDFSSVTGGTKVLSDWIIVQISTQPGEGFLDRMISMVEGAKRKKTPNELSLTILLTALSIIFLLVVTTLLPVSIYSVNANHTGIAITITTLIALLVCLIPTTIGGLLSAIGIAGMGRMMDANVIATSGRAIEASGDISTLLLDKTGTITYGNRQANEFYPLNNVSQDELAKSIMYSSIVDETPEGRSVILLAKQKFNIDESKVDKSKLNITPFSAQTRMSGVDIDGNVIRKGSMDAIKNHVLQLGGEFSNEIQKVVDNIATKGSTPLVVSNNKNVVGVIELKDIVKEGIKEKFIELRSMGIKTIMITGDNKLTAATIAAEAGVDDYLAEATPEAKLELIKKYQLDGYLVAMTGDGTNDAPALAQADVALAMNSGTQAAKDAANMVDLDSSPTKLIQIVEIGKQMLVTRGALTTFSIANDIAKYFAIIPATFMSTYPVLGKLNIMHLSTPSSAILSAVIFNAIIIVALIPIALKGVICKPMSAIALLKRNFSIFGITGIIIPFIGIKLIDMFISIF